MYITYNNTQYTCAGRNKPNRDTIVFSGVKGLPDDAAGEIRLCTLVDAEVPEEIQVGGTEEAPDGADGKAMEKAPPEQVEFELARYDTGDWLRVVVDGGRLTLTNLPEPVPIPEPEPGTEPEMPISAVALLDILLGVT
jgi:hypothetical protein